MPSNLLTAAQLAAIKERQLKEGVLAHILPIRIHNLVFTDIPALLAHIAARDAECERLREAFAIVATRLSEGLSVVIPAQSDMANVITSALNPEQP